MHIVHICFSIILYDNQLMWGLGEIVEALFGNGPEVLDAYSTDTGNIDARLDSDHVSWF